MAGDLEALVERKSGHPHHDSVNDQSGLSYRPLLFSSRDIMRRSNIGCCLMHKAQGKICQCLKIPSIESPAMIQLEE